MNTRLNLKELERKAFQSFYQDGIWDIFFGLIMLAMYTFTLFDNMENKAVRLLLMLFIEIGAIFFLIYGKKQITVPRLGNVAFGPKRKKRLLYIFLTNSISLLVLIALQILRRSGIPFLNSDITSSIFLGIWIVFITSVMAYFLDFNRLYLYGLIYGATFTAVLLLDLPIFFLGAAALILIPGVVILVQFLGKYQPYLEE